MVDYCVYHNRSDTSSCKQKEVAGPEWGQKGRERELNFYEVIRRHPPHHTR